MSVKEKRCVTFEDPEPNLGSSVPNLRISDPSNLNGSRSSLKGTYRNDSRSRPRSRSNSWSRFRARRAKSHDVLTNLDLSQDGLDSDGGVHGDQWMSRMTRTGSRNSVRSLVRLFETRWVNEGRKSQIIFLDDRRLDIIIQPKLYASELLDLVASHVRLKEKQYFGLGFLDDTNHFHWLQGDKRVLDHEFPNPKKSGLLILYFAIKFYVDTIGLLRDVHTVELFYLNARQQLFKGHLQCNTEIVFELAAHVLQATNGDYISDERTKEELKKLPVIPTYTLKEHPSIAYCEERVISHYEKISGTSRGHAIVNYMNIVEGLETYGIHYYDVRDKKDIPWWLGISRKGIAVYDRDDKKTHRKFFHWKNIENLHYRDKKFSIEVHNPKSDVSSNQGSGSSRTIGANNVEVYSWFATTQQLVKCVWSMAIIQHQFYLDRKQSLGRLPVTISMSQIAADLCRSNTSLPGSYDSNISRTSSSHSLLSLSNSRYDLTVEQSDSLKAQRDMLQALKAKRDSLRESLRKKTDELKVLCIQEGELTGQLPRDIPLSPGERPPAFRRRVGTSFSLSVKNLPEADKLSNELSTMELEVELQDQITAAAYRLATDKTVAKYVRKQRKQSYVKSQGKLKDMRKKLEDMRKTIGHSSSNELHPGRSLDGMYSVVHPCTKRDLDMSNTSIVHVPSTNRRRNDSCGNSVYSGDFSDVTVSKGTSSGYYSNSNSSMCSSRSHRLTNDDMSSFCGSMGVSTVKSFRDVDIESDDIHSFGVDDPALSNNLDLNEDQNFTLTRLGRKKHFIISRGLENSRVQEMDSSLNMSKTSIISKSELLVNSHLATSESDLDLDNTLDDSFIGSTSLYGCEDDLREEEEKVCTRVERRRQTFIASRRLMKNLTSDVKHTGFEKGWETFQNILMGEDLLQDGPDFNEDHSHPLENINQKQDLQEKASNDAELKRKIQELIASEAVGGTPFVRSRSFDYSRDLRVNGTKSVSIDKCKDDLKLTKTQPKGKESTIHIKNPFTFLTQRHNKSKQNKHSKSETQSVLNRSSRTVVTPHLDVPANKGSSVQTCVDKNLSEDSKKHTQSSKVPSKPDISTSSTSIKHTQSNKDSSKPDISASSTSIKNKTSSTSKSFSRHISSHGHYPRSTSEASGVSSKRTVAIENRNVWKVGMVKDTSNKSRSSTSSSTSSSKDVSTKCNCDHSSQSHPERRSSWHSNSKSFSMTTKGIETTV